jgi:hypothetical protein
MQQNELMGQPVRGTAIEFNMERPAWARTWVADKVPPRARATVDDTIDRWVLKPLAWALAAAGMVLLCSIGIVVSLVILAAVCEFVVWVL